MGETQIFPISNKYILATDFLSFTIEEKHHLVTQCTGKHEPKISMPEHGASETVQVDLMHWVASTAISAKTVVRDYYMPPL